jgi:aspartate/methionine/tyrosine aminotransferase
LGYLIVPERYIEKMTNAKATMNICTSLPSQLVGEVLLKNWDYLIQQHRHRLKINWQELNRLLPEYHLSLYSIPEAGFFAVFDVSNLNKSSLAVSLELVREFGLNTAPGIDFQNPDPRFIRLNFACPMEDLAPALSRFSSYLQQQLAVSHE